MKPYSPWKILIAAQVSSYFALFTLIISHLLIKSEDHFYPVFFILLIGFLPASIYKALLNTYIPYVILGNALLMITSVLWLLQDVFLVGTFLLVPILALFFISLPAYLFASIGSIVSYFFVYPPNSSEEYIVNTISHMSIFVILIFLLFLVVKELMDHSISEAKHLQTITSLSRSVEAKDVYTRGHSDRVAAIARIIARDIPTINKNEVYYSGLIHDVGKLTTPDYILLKKGKLTPDEYEQIKKHPQEGATICKSLDISEKLIMGVLYHHERWDGKGYPMGLAGKNIPLIGRILCVADSIDAMASNRSYRDALTFDFIYKELEKGQGTQFDPTIADLALKSWDEIVSLILSQMKKEEEYIVGEEYA